MRMILSEMLKNEIRTEVYAEAYAEAYAENHVSAYAEAYAEAYVEGQLEILTKLVKEGFITIPDAATVAGMTEEEFKKIACL